MAYRLDPTRPTPEELRRVLGEQLGRSVVALRAAGGPDASAVHDVRKRIKKARSLLRLGRGDVGAAVARHANGQLRDVAATLAGQRDADAMVETLDRLLEGAGDGGQGATGADPVPADAAGALRAAFAARADALRSEGGVDRSTAHGAAAVLERTSSWLVDVPPRAEGWEALAPGFARQYRRGQAALAGLGDEPTDDDLHDWRKRAKDLWYHQRLLRDLWPEAQRPVVRAAARLADVLGEDHDLAVLAGHLRAPGTDAPVDAGPVAVDPGVAAAVLAVVGSERARLQSEARRLGALLYADTPDGWAARHGAWWRAAAAGVTDRGSPR